MINFAVRRALYRQTLIAAGLAAGLGVSGAALAATDNARDATAHSDSIGAAISDTAITAKVKAKFVGDERLKNSDISVKTTNGVVTLSGTGSPESKSAAASLAKAVEGVRSVDVDVNTPAATGSMQAKTQKVATTTKEAVSDSWITTKVKSAILADSISKGFEVAVDTRNGVVMLDGKLANREAIDHVKDIAMKIEGVKSVNTAGLKVDSAK